MTEISFYSGVNPLAVGDRKLVKAYAQGRRVRVVTPDAAATATLDKLLWELGPKGSCRIISWPRRMPRRRRSSSTTRASTAARSTC